MDRIDKHDYHFISLKFLTAIILALFFAFLLIYVFSPVKDDYSVYSFEQEEIEKINADSFLAESGETEIFLDLAQKEAFENELKSRSFAVMEQSKRAVLTVITGNHLEEINGLKEEGDLLLNDYRLELKNEEEELLQQKRKELETDLSSKLQNLRQQVREKYSSYSQQEIGSNYLKMINLRIAVEVLAQNDSEKEEYQKRLNQLETEQEELLAEKNAVLNEEISAETRTLIMEFNQQFSDYREQIRNRHQNLIANRKDELDMRLSRQRDSIRFKLEAEREEKASAMDQLIERSRKYY
ncbi:MAG: hypothetical protein ACOCUG_01415 [Halanaerobium sp.]